MYEARGSVLMVCVCVVVLRGGASHRLQGICLLTMSGASGGIPVTFTSLPSEPRCVFQHNASGSRFPIELFVSRGNWTAIGEPEVNTEWWEGFFFQGLDAPECSKHLQKTCHSRRHAPFSVMVSGKATTDYHKKFLLTGSRSWSPPAFSLARGRIFPPGPRSCRNT